MRPRPRFPPWDKATDLQLAQWVGWGGTFGFAAWQLGFNSPRQLRPPTFTRRHEYAVTSVPLSALLATREG